MWHPGPDVLTATGAVLGALAAALKGAERRLVETLDEHQAFDLAHALQISAPSLARRLAVWRLAAGGAVQRAGAGVWLDRAGYLAFRQRRRRRALFVLLALLATGVALLLAGVIKL